MTIIAFDTSDSALSGGAGMQNPPVILLKSPLK
jgi:hypothetical protein